MFVMAFRIEFVPLKETTMSLFVESVATKPVTSVKRELHRHHCQLLKSFEASYDLKLTFRTQ